MRSVIAVLFVAVVLTACSSGSSYTSPNPTSSPTPSVNDVVATMFALTKTAEAKAGATATIQAAVQQAVGATQTAQYREALKASLSETLEFPGVAQISRPNKFGEAVPFIKMGYSAGAHTGDNWDYVFIRYGNPEVKDVGKDPMPVIQSPYYVNGPNTIGPVPIEIDGQPAAMKEMDLPALDSSKVGRGILIVALSPNSKAYLTVAIFTTDKSRWQQLKPLAEEMVSTIKWLN